MKEQAKELKEAISLLSTLSVSGDVVDLIAAVKTKMRKVIHDLEEAENG